MSTTTLYKLYKTRVRSIAEFENGFGSAPVLWEHLCKRYLRRPSGSWLSGDLKPLWALASDPRVPIQLRQMHAFTFDYASCPKERVAELAESCEQGYLILSGALPDFVNNWLEIAKALRAVNLDARARGVVIQATSVTDMWENTDDYSKAWDMFEATRLRVEGKEGK